MGNDASVPGDYKEPELPEGLLEVRISVYKLSISGVDVLDAIGAGILGTYHTGLVVAGEEWSYGGHNYKGKSGVYKSTPEMNTDYIFYQRIVMGRIATSTQNTEDSIRKFATTPKWAGPCYDLLERNCNHFTSDLCWLLLKKRPPDWINSTADGLARTQRRICTEHAAMSELFKAYQMQYSPLPLEEIPPEKFLEIPGARAYCDAFKSTFELAWKKGNEQGQSIIENSLLDDCHDNNDPEAFKRSVEEGVLVAATEAASTAAEVVATAARTATVARAAQPVATLAIWDAVWAKESASLLKMWRESAVAGELGPEGHLERSQQVEIALLAAANAGNSTTELMEH